MKLHEAYTLAHRIKDELSRYCDQIEVAGSIRRAREWCNDIDLVVLPKAGEEARLRARVLQRTTAISHGAKNLITRLNTGVQLDIFFAHAGTRDLLDAEPGNWGSVLLCRTGSKEHNIYLATRAQELGLKWETMRGLVSAEGKVVASLTEEEIFATLGLEWIAPALRER